MRLLRQDVGNLTATATTKAEAARLRASVQKITIDALEQNRQIASTAAEMSRRMHRDSVTAAQEAAEQAVRGLEREIQAAANHMRLEAVRGRKEALYNFGGGLAVFGGLLALGAFSASWRCSSSRDAAMHGRSESTLSPIARQQAGRSRLQAMAVASVVSGSIHQNRRIDGRRERKRGMN